MTNWSLFVIINDENHMPFIDGLKTYFTVVLDASIFLMALFVAAGFVIYCLPKVLNRKEILKLALIFVVGYATCILFPSLMFALTNLIQPLILKQIVYATAMPIVVGVFSLIFTKGTKLHLLVKTAILVASVVVTDVISKNMGFLIPWDIPFVSYLFRSITYIFFTGICFLMNRIDITHYRNLPKEGVIVILTLSTVLVGFGVFEQGYMSNDKTVNVLLCILDVFLLVILALSYYAAYKNIEHRHRITNLEVQKTLEDAEKMSIAIDKTNREELEKLRHDMKNQLSYVEILIKQGKNEEAEKYIDEYINSSSEVLNSFSCSNNVINSIINLELTKAKISKIKVDVKVVVPPLLPFKDNDLVSLLTNMIDNAIENYYSEKEDKITVRIIKQNDFIRFIVSNPIDLSKTNIKNLTKTSKVGRGHGYGTKIIKNIASAYNGYVDFGIEDNRFICDAVLNLNIKE